jgi:recombination DNA repair RAD52 pathway protein
MVMAFEDIAKCNKVFSSSFSRQIQLALNFKDGAEFLSRRGGLK